MSEILDRVARSAGVNPDQARAVLQALHEPSAEMLEAGIDAGVRQLPNSEGAELAIWRAMVERALVDGSGEP